MKQFNKLFFALSVKPLMLLSFFALLPTIASAQCPDNNHPHMIDLGLPSGTKWACCNVGASKPEDYGGYFAWGETEEKDVYDWSTYIHCDGSEDTSHDIGKDIAGTQYDAATANWGSPWVMPNNEQMEELYNKCSSEWTTENGVNGRRFTGPNGASVFLPAAGFRWKDDLYDAGSDGYYWSSKLYESSTYKAWHLYFYNGNVNTFYISRYNGFSVRPVVASFNQVELQDGDIFTAITEEGVELTYKVISAAEKTCQVGNGDDFSCVKGKKETYGTITIPSVVNGFQVIRISENAFNQCKSSKISIPNSIKEIEKFAFIECTGIEDYELHEGLVSIGRYGLARCNIKRITIPSTLLSIGSSCFEGDDISSLYIPASVTYISEGAFSLNRNLTEIVVSEENPIYDSRNNCNAIMETSSNRIIQGCNATTIPVETSGIGYGSFDGADQIKQLIIPENVTTIGYYAFFHCEGLETLTLPSTLNYLGKWAFRYCTALKEINVNMTEPFTIDEGVFSPETYQDAILYVPAGTKEKYEATAGWNKFQNIVEMGASSGIAIDATNFPDENFRNWVLSHDYGQDGVLTEAEIDGVTEIDIDSQNIADLKGIEYFTALTQLWCDYNELTSLDVSKNTALTRLCCAGNQLTSLDLSQNTALITLYCYENQINETEMGKLVESLPANNGELLVKRLDISNEQNVITTEQVAAAKAKGWYVLALDGNVGEWGEWVEYDGDASAGIPINSTTFPDENFRNWVLAQDYGQDGVLTETEIAGVMEIDVNNKNIASLKGIEYFTALTYLDCSNNQLTSLDVAQNTALTQLRCYSNQLTALDVSNITALTMLDCPNNQLTSLDVSQNTALWYLNFGDNQLTSLDVSQNTALTQLYCNRNQISETEMGNLVKSLPANNGQLYVKDLNYAGEQNVITTTLVAAAKAKGWTVYAFDSNAGDWGDWVEYDGDEPKDISPVNEGETIDIGNEIDENTSLDGNVVGDVYYSISSGDGNYDAAEGCLVVTKPTDDSAIDGQDIFGEDFKDNYTGIVFKLAPGKGSIKVEAETQGNMVLKVKIGNSEPIEMELDGKLKVKFPYNVSEPTYVYIYGGMGAAGAKAMGANRAKSAADLLKIYGFEIVSDPSGIGAIENGQQADAPVYNLNGQRVNTPGKGIYIKNGRKVLVK